MTNILEQLYNDCLENEENGFNRYVAIVPVFYLRAVSAYSRQMGFDLQKLPQGEMRDEIDAMIAEGFNSIMPDNVISLPDLLGKFDTLNGHLESINGTLADSGTVLEGIRNNLQANDDTRLAQIIQDMDLSGGSWDNEEIADLISTLAAILAAL